MDACTEKSPHPGHQLGLTLLRNSLNVVGNAAKITKLLKYDGNPFLPNEVYQKCKELV